MWYTKCPRCGNYMAKKEPDETYLCCACGWEDQNHATFFCEVINTYCSRMPKS